jgi:hypothetical protein
MSVVEPPDNVKPVVTLHWSASVIPNEPDNLVETIAALALISALTFVTSVIPSDCIFVSGIILIYFVFQF